jgi:hypothetical protein
MDRKSLTFFVVLAASITLRLTPITAQRSEDAGQSAQSVPNNGQPKQQSGTAQSDTGQPSRGTQASPVVVQLLPVAKTQDETAQIERERDEKTSAEQWTKWLGGLTVFVMVGQLVVYLIQAGRLSDTIAKMDEIAKAQGDDMKKSIAEANKAAIAMGDVAAALKDSLKVSEDMVALAKLSRRPWIGILNNEGAIEDRDGSVMIRSRVVLQNFGQSPAFAVHHNCRIQHHPPSALTAEECEGYMREPYTGIGSRMTVMPSGTIGADRNGQFPRAVNGVPMVYYLIGRIDYLDEDGQAHVTTYASHFERPSGLTILPIYNEAT